MTPSPLQEQDGAWSMRRLLALLTLGNAIGRAEAGEPGATEGICRCSETPSRRELSRAADLFSG